MEIDVDCRGLLCPKPVIMTREALKERNNTFCVLVDNDASRENVQRFATNSGCAVEVSKHPDGFVIEVTPGAASGERAQEEPVTCSVPSINKVIFIGADEVGRGDRELGTTLIKAFLYACTENDDRAAKYVFMNSGVRLVTENEETIKHVKKLEEEGAEIVVCGTCLDFYGLKERLEVGRVSNMYEIQSIMVSADRLVSV